MKLNRNKNFAFDFWEKTINHLNGCVPNSKTLT